MRARNEWRRPNGISGISLSRALVGSLLATLLSVTAWSATGFEVAMARVEARMQGRVGVFAMRGSAWASYRADERFAYCSTFKWVLGAAVLKSVDEGRLELDRKVRYGPKDLISMSPFTSAHLKQGSLSVGELCAATIITSDNTAANLLEPLVGGPSGMQTFVRNLGDPVMRFDRMEPELNSNLPGDPRDTTTPEAMARLLHRVLEAKVLSKGSRDQLLAWMQAVETGMGRIHAGVPKGWIVAHKTGTGYKGAVNDVAVIYPPKGEPIYLCVFTDGDRLDTKAHEAAIAETTRLVVETLHEGPRAHSL
ncbi:MAG: class A beta-lactamase [Holophaga sp.]|nr:class A beta-lactamase [Holophaga sp.]